MLLDCQALGRAFALHNGESPDTKIKGFTIRNGQPGPASYAGLGGGGAIAVINSGLRLEDCVFDACFAPQGGGALDLQNVTVCIDNCTFRNNGQLTTYSPGGAIRANGGSLMLQSSLFEQNRGSAGGALLSASPGYSFVERCIFRGNSAQVYGGAVVFQSPATLHDCLIIGNSAPSGGGIALKAGNELVQCTIINNTATLTAGGVYAAYSNVGGGAALALNDSVIWGNSAPSGAQIGSVSFFDIVRLHSCDVAGGAGGVSIGGGTLDYDASNLAVDPQFADVNGRLGPLSPCIDAGDNTLVPADILDLDGDSNTSEPVPFDLDGRARFYDSPTVTDTGVGPAPICDIGAYEWQP